MARSPQPRRYHRPPAILLENVPGLLSSNAGRDFGRLLREMGELGYWWAYRILDARHFGVPQRRRRVFIVGLHAGAGFGADSAAAVLSVGSRCHRHPATGHATGAGVADSPVPGIDIARAVTGTSGKRHDGKRHDDDTDTPIAPTLREHVRPGSNMDFSVLSSSPDPGGVRAADGLAGRLDDSQLAATLNSGGNSGGFRTEPGEHLVAFRKSARVNADPDSPESWVDDGLANTLNNFDVGDVRTTHAVLGRSGGTGASVEADALLPLGLDSHRYRCCGNGVVSDVSEWIGWRLAAVMT